MTETSAFLAEGSAVTVLRATRLPAEEQFRRWAERTPPGFQFAPKLPGNRPRTVGEFSDRVRVLGDRLGPVRVQLINARDEGMLELLRSCGVGSKLLTGGGIIPAEDMDTLAKQGVGRLFGPSPADYLLGGIIVSWVGFVLAMVAIDYLARLDLPRRRAERAVLLTAIFPFAFFYGVVYTESVFLLFTVASFYFFRTRRWILGGVCGGLATATRINGILMLPALAWIAWRGAGPDRRERLRALAGLALVCGGIGLYSLYVYWLSGNPFEWAASIERWGYHPGGAPWLALVRIAQALVMRPYAFLAGERMAPYDTLNGVAALAFVAAVPFVWRRFGAAYGLFMLANLWLPLSSGQYEGLGRYCAVLFPCFIWLASLRSRAASTALVVLFAMFYTLCLALFATIHPLF